MKEPRQILAQLVDSERLSAVNPLELRAMLTELDDEVVYGDSPTVITETGIPRSSGRQNEQKD